MSGDITSLQGDVGGMQTGAIATVTNDLTNVQNDLSALRTLGPTPQVTTSTQVMAGNLASAQQWAKKHSC